MNNIKDKLIEIVKKGIADNAVIEDDCIVDFDCNDFDHACEDIADNILSNLDSILEGSEWIKLPCKIGDKVYIPWVFNNTSCIIETRVEHIGLTERFIRYRFDFETDNEELSTTFRTQKAEAFNKTWFLTREQAEARLKELQK